MKKIAMLFAVACSVLLSGCATTFSSQVSVFHEWPAAATDKSYIFERAPGQENNPEHKLYEDMLRNRLQVLGFTEISAGATPAMKVGMKYGTTLREIQYSPLWHPAIYDPFWNMHFSRGIYRYRLGYPYPYWGWGGYPRYWTDFSLRATYLHQLEIHIDGISPAKKLADIKVSSEQTELEISTFMPWMMDSALHGFPGKNGSTIEVEIKMDK
ncbi:hypothetical protein ACO0LM_25625 [Undibacterium sp. Di26W]|uniref:hypothetical protein n=1 Tax=Undibacterium sp. Di26W TaxID=3413035 RepID=UPI003BF22551